MLLVAADVRSADVRDRDGRCRCWLGHRIFPWQHDVFADGGYAETKLQTALAVHGSWTLEIVKRSDAELESERSGQVCNIIQSIFTSIFKQLMVILHCDVRAATPNSNATSLNYNQIRY